jgi:site-specific DNA recombinase
VTSAVIAVRVSSARQKKDETIASQTAALRGHALELGLDVPDEWVFEDEGHSGATLIRPALERLRDLIAGVGIDVVLCYSPDWLARKFAYQALLLEEFARAGTRVEFINGPRGDSPEDRLLVQFQSMFAEYDRRYADDGASIADLTRWLSEQGVPTRTGKHRWDRSVVWGMLRNPAYAGRAVLARPWWCTNRRA